MCNRNRSLQQCAWLGEGSRIYVDLTTLQNLACEVGELKRIAHLACHSTIRAGQIQEQETCYKKQGFVSVLSSQLAPLCLSESREELSGWWQDMFFCSMPAVVCHFPTTFVIVFNQPLLSLILSLLQWTITHARPILVSMVGAACRRGTAIAATALRASQERAARSVSHCRVKLECGDLTGQQLQTHAVSLWHKEKRAEAYAGFTFSRCSMLWGVFMRKTPSSLCGIWFRLCSGLWIPSHWADCFVGSFSSFGSSSLTESEKVTSICCKSAICARGCWRHVCTTVCAIISTWACLYFPFLSQEQEAAHLSTQLCEEKVWLSENDGAVI